MMTMRQRILAVVGAAALLVGTLSTGLGYDDDYVDTSSVTILPGPLTAMLTWASFEEQSEGMSVNSLDGYLTLRVLDERGYATGWNVSMSAMDYSGPGGHIGAGQLALSPGSVSMVRGNPDLASHSTFSVDPMYTNPTWIWSVPDLSGDGEYDLTFGGTLDMPGDQDRNDIYTVIVNIDGVAP